MPTLEDEHLSEAYGIWITAGWNDAYRLSEPDFIKSWMASPVKVGCWSGDRLVAIGRSNTDGIIYAMIYDVVVDPGHRSRGYGKAIVKELVDILKGMNIRAIQLMSASGQSGFYKKLGFRERRRDRPGMEL